MCSSCHAIMNLQSQSQKKHFSASYTQAYDNWGVIILYEDINAE